MARKGLLLYHIAVALYFLWLDVQSFLVVYNIVRNRQDYVDDFLVKGYGLQFFTIWGNVALHIFSFTVLAEDLIEVAKFDLDERKKKKLHSFNNWLFTCINFPASVVIVSNFWPMYTLMDRKLVERVVPPELTPTVNQCLHTLILILPIVEMFLSCKSYIRRRQGLFSAFWLMFSYGVLIIALKEVSGTWPYPFMDFMSVPVYLVFFALNVILTMGAYLLGEYITRVFWGKQIGILHSEKTR